MVGSPSLLQLDASEGPSGGRTDGQDDATLDQRASTPIGGLLLHAAALLLVLGAAAAVIGVHGRYSTDEGAVVVTLHSLAEGRGWLTPHPMPDVDSTGRNYPLMNSDWGTKGVSAYAKHPAYPALLSVTERVWPGGGPVAVSILGTAAAALLAALLAQELSPGSEVGSLWIVGVASPLFFDAQLLLAHTLAAATAAAGVLAALRFVAAGRQRPSLVLLATVAAATTATALLRTEGLLLALGLAVAFLVAAGRRQEQRTRSALVGVVLVGAAGLARLIDVVAFRAIIGTAVASPAVAGDTGSGSFLSQRSKGFVVSLLQPSYLAGPWAVLLGLSAALFAVACAVSVRRRPATEPAALLALAGGICTVFVAVAFTPVGPPGLLIAFPIGWVGLMFAARFGRFPAAAGTVALGAGLYALAVIGTQYAVGGGAEWGGRYFALALPLVAPLAVGGLRAAMPHFDVEPRRLAAAGLTLSVLGLSILGVRTLHRSETFSFARSIPTGQGLGERPVVVTTWISGPRLTGRNLDDHRWLLADRNDPGDLVPRLRRAGIRRFVLMTSDPKADAPVVAGARRVSLVTVTPWTYVVYAT